MFGLSLLVIANLSVSIIGSDGVGSPSDSGLCDLSTLQTIPLAQHLVIYPWAVTQVAFTVIEADRYEDWI